MLYFIIGIILIADALVGYNFYRLACRRGYSPDLFAILCIVPGPLTWLIVSLLPDRNIRR